MSQRILTQDELNNIFDYCGITGILKWKEDRGYKVKAGDIAGSVFYNKKKRYMQVTINRSVYKLHRIIWKMVHNEYPEEIDHIDGNGLNNILSNLRKADSNINSRNKRLNSKNTSGQMGVFLNKRNKKWVARIQSNYNVIYLGSFISFNEAVLCRKKAEKKYNFHVNHGLPRVI